MKPKTILISAVIIIALLCLALIWYFQSPKPSKSLEWVKEYNTSEEAVIGSVPLDLFGDDEAYAIGANKHGYAVFKNPDKAYEKFILDYKDAIADIKEQYQLDNISYSSFSSYGAYGWQMPPKNSERDKEYSDISSFVDIFANSFPKRFR